jgi:hypothetical protein
MITPIDLQINMNQLHEIGKGEQSRNVAVTGQQQFLDDESSQAANLKKAKLDEAQKGEQAGLRDSLSNEKEKQGRRESSSSNEQNEKTPLRKPSVLDDEKLGREIDIFK